MFRPRCRGAYHPGMTNTPRGRRFLSAAAVSAVMLGCGDSLPEVPADIAAMEDAAAEPSAGGFGGDRTAAVPQPSDPPEEVSSTEDTPAESPAEPKPDASVAATPEPPVEDPAPEMPDEPAAVVEAAKVTPASFTGGPAPAADLPFDADTPPDMPAVGPEGAVRMSYDHIDLLKILGLDPVPADVGDALPQWMRDLDGQRVRLRGFMFPPFTATGLRGFVLARDNEICCFGRDPKIYDIIPVEMREGVTTDYIEGRPFDVVGVFHVEPEADDGELYQLFYITDALVIAD